MIKYGKKIGEDMLERRDGGGEGVRAWSRRSEFLMAR